MSRHLPPISKDTVYSEALVESVETLLNAVKEGENLGVVYNKVHIVMNELSKSVYESGRSFK